MKFLFNLFKKETLGFGVLKPWRMHRFASGTMSPRFDANGNIYMLICDKQVYPTHWMPLPEPPIGRP